jgi:protein-S-isoprenylcysteine O-methyltransferase Ste14
MATTLLARGFQMLWVAWGIIWLLAAPWSASARTQQGPRERLLHLAPLLLGGALFFAAPSEDNLLGWRIIPGTVWLPWIGLTMTAIGLLFAIWARLILGKMWSGRVTLKEEHALVQRGPYALARHPIYTGLLLALLGTALARGTVSHVLGFLVIFSGLMFKLRQEERLLAGHFGASYDAYRAKVKGLVPFIL